MRPINLLPPYIYDKQKKVQLAAFWGIAALAVVGGFIYWQMQINSVLAGIAEEKATADSLQTKYTSLNSQISAEDQKIATIKSKQEFIAAAQTHNAAWPEAYSMIRDVVSPRVILRRIIIDPQTRGMVSMAGAAPTEMDIVKWWMALRNDHTHFQSVRFELPPHPYVPGGGQAAAGGLGMAGAPGGVRRGPGGFSGGPGSGGPMPQITGTSGFSGGPGGGGMPQITGASGLGGAPGSGGGFSGGYAGITGGAGGFRGAGGGAQSADVGPAILEGRPVINFVAVAVLNQPLAGGLPAPTWPPSGGGGAGGAGGFSSPGGGMPQTSGFSGGPGGMGSPGGGSPGGSGGGSMRTAE